MISNQLADLLIEQIGHEFAASHTYLAMASYFSAHNLDGWADFYFRQSAQERDHALKITRFLLEVGVNTHFPAVPAAHPDFESPLDCVSRSLAQEEQVSQAFRKMASVALEQHDHTGYQFMQWFLEEQIEEEATFARLRSILASGLNPFQAESLLPGR